MTFIPEEEYQNILKTMPVFCADYLIFAEKKYLLIKRNQEPMKDAYWVVEIGRAHVRTPVTA